MRAVICALPGIAPTLADVASSAGFDPIEEPSHQEFGSLLFRDLDALGVLWCVGPASAIDTVDRLRQGDVRSPIIVLLGTQPRDARRASNKRAAVITAGADDVQGDAIDPRELAARLLALRGRRERAWTPAGYEFLDCRFDPSTGRLAGAAGTVNLTTHETRLFEALVLKGGALLTRQAAMDALYGGMDEPQRKVLDVFVCKLRRKVCAVTGGVDVIETCWSEGYRFVAAGFRPAITDMRKRVLA